MDVTATQLEKKMALGRKRINKCHREITDVFVLWMLHQGTWESYKQSQMKLFLPVAQ